MSTIIPRCSQFRFYKSNLEINYTNIQPSFDFRRLRTKYQKGIEQGNFYMVQQKGIQFEVEFFYSGTPYSAYLKNVDTGTQTSLTIYNITPSDWTGDNIYKLRTTINTVGFYTLSFNLSSVFPITSDIFYVKERDYDLIKISFSDSKNRNGGVWYNSYGSKIWNPSAYYTGTIIKQAPDFDENSFTSENNNVFSTLKTPKLNYELTLTEINELYLDNVTHQLSCDTITVNNESYTVNDISIDRKDNSDLIDIIVNLSKNDNNGYQQLL